MTRRGQHSGNAGNGGHWIRSDKRRKIYERDSWKCLWCLAPIGQLIAGVMRPTPLASLDHFLPRSKGGCNLSTNVFTSCQACNSRRGDMSALEFVHKAVALRLTVLEFAHRPNRIEAQLQLLERILTAIDNPVESAATLRRLTNPPLNT